MHRTCNKQNRGCLTSPQDTFVGKKMSLILKSKLSKQPIFTDPILRRVQSCGMNEVSDQDQEITDAKFKRHKSLNSVFSRLNRSHAQSNNLNAKETKQGLTSFKIKEASGSFKSAKSFLGSFKSNHRGHLKMNKLDSKEEQEQQDNSSIKIIYKEMSKPQKHPKRNNKSKKQALTNRVSLDLVDYPDLSDFDNGGCIEPTDSLTQSLESDDSMFSHKYTSLDNERKFSLKQKKSLKTRLGLIMGEKNKTVPKIGSFKYLQKQVPTSRPLSPVNTKILPERLSEAKKNYKDVNEVNSLVSLALADLQEEDYQEYQEKYTKAQSNYHSDPMVVPMDITTLKRDFIANSYCGAWNVDKKTGVLHNNSKIARYSQASADPDYLQTSQMIYEIQEFDRLATLCHATNSEIYDTHSVDSGIAKTENTIAQYAHTEPCESVLDAAKFINYTPTECPVRPDLSSQKKSQGMDLTKIKSRQSSHYDNRRISVELDKLISLVDEDFDFTCHTMPMSCPVDIDTPNMTKPNVDPSFGRFQKVSNRRPKKLDKTSRGSIVRKLDELQQYIDNVNFSGQQQPLTPSTLRSMRSKRSSIKTEMNARLQDLVDFIVDKMVTDDKITSLQDRAEQKIYDLEFGKKTRKRACPDRQVTKHYQKMFNAFSNDASGEPKNKQRAFTIKRGNKEMSPSYTSTEGATEDPSEAIEPSYSFQTRSFAPFDLNEEKLNRQSSFLKKTYMYYGSNIKKENHQQDEIRPSRLISNERDSVIFSGIENIPTTYKLDGVIWPTN